LLRKHKIQGRHANHHAMNAPLQEEIPAIYRQTLASSPLLRNIDEQGRQELLSLGRLRRWPRGARIFGVGEPIAVVCYILEGRVREYYCDAAGDEYLRRLADPGCYVALHNVFSHEPLHTNTCEALTPVLAMSWPAAALVEHLRHNPPLSLGLAAALASAFEQSCRRNCLCRKPGSRSRVAGYLLSRLCVRCDRPCGSADNHQHEVDLRPVGHAADEIHLARETFTRTLLSLQDEGIISCRRGLITIHDIGMLKNLSGIE